jgi:hypothetical protein
MTTENVLVASDHYGRKHAATQWDWRNVGGKNFITPAQDQGACQASTAFAVTGTMNAKLRIWFKIPLGPLNQVLVPDLSAGDLFFCGGGSCSGGLDVEQALAYATDKGVVPAYNIPYNPAGQTCGRGSSELEMRVTKISVFVTLRTVSTMKDAIESRGPIIATLRAYQDLKQNYKSGVYRYDGKSPFLYTQTVSVIGFTTDGWLCKNSWGPNWGMGGVFCIAYGECGIDDETMWEIAGFNTTYPYGTVSGTPEVGMYRNGPLRILYRDTSGTIQDLSAYPPSATQPFPLDGLAAGSNPSFGGDSNKQIYAIRTDILGYIQFNTWNNGWSKVQWLTGPQGLTDGPPAAGQPGVVGGPYVFYRDASGNIHNVYFDGQKWTWQQVTGGAGLKAPPAAGDPQPSEFQGALYVCYRDIDGNIQQLQYTGGKWNVQQATGGGQTTAPPAIGDPIVTVFHNLLRIFYRAKTGALQHIWHDSLGSKWGWEPLPVKMAAAGDPVCTYYNDYLHMFYRESRGFIWHVYWVNGWGEEQLTGPGLSGGALAEGEPAATSFGSEIHVVYRDVNDNLSDAYWTGTTWTHLVRI